MSIPNENYTATVTVQANGGNITTANPMPVVTKPYIPGKEIFYTTGTSPITDTTVTPLMAAAGTGLKNYLTHIQLQNTHATVATEVTIKNDTTVIWAGKLPALMTAPVNIAFGIPLQSSANKALNIVATTTGANIYVNAQGYTD